VPSVTARLHGPNGEQIWTAQIDTETHFNLAASGPGIYKIWCVMLSSWTTKPANGRRKQETSPHCAAPAAPAQNDEQDAPPKSNPQKQPPKNPNSFYSAYESRVDVVVDLVYFTLGHLRRPGQVQVPRGTEESRGKEVASHDHLEGVKRNVLVVSELVEILSGEQRYLARKLERHMRTARSSNRRAFWYTALEVLIVLLVGGAQVGVVRGWFKGGPTRITV
jgi:hypothetical protein